MRHAFGRTATSRLARRGAQASLTAAVTAALLGGCSSSASDDHAGPAKQPGRSVASDAAGSAADTRDCPSRLTGQQSPNIAVVRSWNPLAFSGEFVAFAGPEGEGGPDGEQYVHIGEAADLMATETSPDLVGTDLRVAAGADGFAIAYMRAAEGTDLSSAGAYLRRVGYDGATVWEVRLPVKTLGDVHSTVDEIHANGLRYAWDDGAALGRAEHEQGGWAAEPATADLNHESELVSVYGGTDTEADEVRSGDWTVTIDTGGNRTMLRGSSDSGQTWSREVPEDTTDLASCGPWVYAITDEVLSIIDPTTGDQTGSFPAPGHSLMAVTPAGAVFTTEDGYVNWAW